jgi:hypothetical protein
MPLEFSYNTTLRYYHLMFHDMLKFLQGYLVLLFNSKIPNTSLSEPAQIFMHMTLFSNPASNGLFCYSFKEYIFTLNSIIPLLNPSKIDLYDSKTLGSLFVICNYPGVQLGDPYSRNDGLRPSKIRTLGKSARNGL